MPEPRRTRPQRRPVRLTLLIDRDREFLVLHEEHRWTLLRIARLAHCSIRTVARGLVRARLTRDARSPHAPDRVIDPALLGYLEKHYGQRDDPAVKEWLGQHRAAR